MIWAQGGWPRPGGGWRERQRLRSPRAPLAGIGGRGDDVSDDVSADPSVAPILRQLEHRGNRPVRAAERPEDRPRPLRASARQNARRRRGLVDGRDRPHAIRSRPPTRPTAPDPRAHAPVRIFFGSERERSRERTAEHERSGRVTWALPTSVSTELFIIGARAGVRSSSARARASSPRSRSDPGTPPGRSALGTADIGAGWVEAPGRRVARAPASALAARSARGIAWTAVLTLPRDAARRSPPATGRTPRAASSCSCRGPRDASQGEPPGFARGIRGRVRCRTATGGRARSRRRTRRPRRRG